MSDQRSMEVTHMARLTIVIPKPLRRRKVAMPMRRRKVAKPLRRKKGAKPLRRRKVASHSARGVGRQLTSSPPTGIVLITASTVTY